MGSKASKKKTITGKDAEEQSQKENVRTTKRRSIEDRPQSSSDQQEHDQVQPLKDSKSSSECSGDSESDCEEAVGSKAPPAGSLGYLIKGNAKLSPSEAHKEISEEDLSNEEERVSKTREITEMKSKKPRKRRKESLDAVEGESRTETNTEVSQRIQKQGGFMMPSGLISELKENQGMPKLRPTKANINKIKGTTEKNEQHPQMPILKPLNKNLKHLTKAEDEKQQERHAKDGVMSSDTKISSQKCATDSANQDLKPSKPDAQSSFNEIDLSQSAKKKPIPLKRTRVGNSTENLLADQSTKVLTGDHPQPQSRIDPRDNASVTNASESGTSEIPSALPTRVKILPKEDQTSSEQDLSKLCHKDKDTYTDSASDKKIEETSRSSQKQKRNYLEQPKDSSNFGISVEKFDVDADKVQSDLQKQHKEDTRDVEECYKTETVLANKVDEDLLYKRVPSMSEDCKRETENLKNETILKESHKQKQEDSGFQDDLQVHTGAPLERASVPLKTYTSEFEMAISEISNVSIENHQKQQEILVKADDSSSISKIVDKDQESSAQEIELEKLQAFIDLELKEFNDMLNVIDKPSDPLQDPSSSSEK